MHPAAIPKRTAHLINQLATKADIVLQWDTDSEDETKVVIQKFSRTGRFAAFDGSHPVYMSVELTESGYQCRYASESFVISDTYQASDIGVFAALSWILQISYGTKLGLLLLSSLKMAIYWERLISDAEARQDKMDSGDMVDGAYSGVGVIWPEYEGEDSWREHE